MHFNFDNLMFIFTIVMDKNSLLIYNFIRKDLYKEM